MGKVRGNGFSGFSRYSRGADPRKAIRVPPTNAPGANPLTRMKILVVKRDKIGDLLLATPMLRVIRTALPDARIDLLASDYNAWLLEGNRDIDRVWTYRRA